MPRYRIVEYQMLASAIGSLYDHMMMVKKAMTQRHLEFKFRQSVQVMEEDSVCYILSMLMILIVFPSGKHLLAIQP